MGILVAFPIAAAIAILDKRKIEDFLFLAVEMIIALIIITGFFGNTVPGVYGGIILGIISFIYCSVVYITDRERFRKSVCTPGLGCGVICIAVAAYMLIGKTDIGTGGDAYWAHAPQVLNMYRFSDIGNIGTRVGTFQLLYTAPIYTSWCYFCNKLWFCYSDGINLWARHIYIYFGLLPFLTFVKKMDWKKILLMSVLLSFLPEIVDAPYDFMPDIPIGATMVYGTLMTIKLFEDKVRYNDVGYLLGACFSVMYICIMKRAGGIYIFSIVGIATVYTIDRFRLDENKVRYIKRMIPLVLLGTFVGFTRFFSVYRNTYYVDEIYYNYIPYLGFFAFLIVGVISWFIKFWIQTKRYITISVMIGVLVIGGVIILLQLASIITEKKYGGSRENVQKVFFDFFSMWFSGRHFLGTRFRQGWALTDFLFVLMSVGVILIVRYLVEKKRLFIRGSVSDIDNIVIPALLGYVLYMMYYCFLYMVWQDHYYVGRYDNRYLGPSVMVIAAIVIYILLSIRSNSLEMIIAGVVIFFAIVLPYNPFEFVRLDNGVGWKQYNEMYMKSGVTLQEDDKILLVGEVSGIYYVFPAQSDVADKEVLNGEKSIEEWAEEIISDGYNYLIIQTCEQSFSDEYQKMFVDGIESIQNWTIYSIIVENGTVRFIKH